MKPGFVKKVCRHWLQGHCEQGDNCVFLHGDDSQLSARNGQNLMQVQNAARQESSLLMSARAREAAIAQQQVALRNLTQQNFIQQGGTGVRQIGSGIMSDERLLQNSSGLVQGNARLLQGGTGLMQGGMGLVNNSTRIMQTDTEIMQTRIMQRSAGLVPGPAGMMQSAAGMMQSGAAGMMQSAAGMMQPSAAGMMQSAAGMMQPGAAGMMQSAATGLMQNSAGGLMQGGSRLMQGGVGLAQGGSGGMMPGVAAGIMQDGTRLVQGGPGFVQGGAGLLQRSPGLVQPGVMTLPMMSQQVPGIQQTLMMSPGDLALLQQQQQAILAGHRFPSSLNLGGDSFQSTGMVPRDTNRKRRSRFHDSDEVLLTSTDTQNEEQNPLLSGVGLYGQSPVMLGAAGQMGMQQAVLPQPAYGQVSIGQRPLQMLPGTFGGAPMSVLAPAGPMPVLGSQGAPQDKAMQLGQGRTMQDLISAQFEHDYELRHESQTSEGRSRRKKSRFDDSYDECDSGAAQNEYQPDDPTEDEDFIEDFVDKIMAGAHPRIIQPEDKSKKKGITIKNMFVPEKRRAQRPGLKPAESEYESEYDSRRNQVDRNPVRISWNAKTPSESREDNYHQERDIAYRHGQSNNSPHVQRQDSVHSYERQYAQPNNSFQSRDVYGHYGFEGQLQQDVVQDQIYSQQSRSRTLGQLPEPHWSHSRIEVQDGQSYNKYGTYQNYRSEIPDTLEKLQAESSLRNKQFEGARIESEKFDADSGVTPPRVVVYGRDLPPFILKFMKNAGKYEGGVLRVTKSFKLPVNCIGLVPPKMNTEAWGILTKKAQTRDEMLQDTQRWFASGVIPLLEQVHFFGKGSRIMQDVCRYTSDSLNVLAFVCTRLSIRRRLLLRNALHKKYAVLCRRTRPVTGGEFLFGNTLPGDLLAVKAGTFRIPETENNSEDKNKDDPESENFKPTFFANLGIPKGEVDESVANIINMACSNDADVSDLRNKYKIPHNCKRIVPPKINPEMWSLVSRSGLELDNRLQDVHLSIAEAMVPLMLMLQSVHENKYDENETITLLSDALLLLGNSTYLFNKVRMDAMRKSLPEQVHGYCGFAWPGAEKISLERHVGKN